MSKIEWTGRTWNPIITGCEKKSAGCKFCYAIAMARRLAAMGQKRYEGVVKKVGDSNVWTWTGIIKTDYSSLNKPFKVKKPNVWFVNSMTDLFWEKVDVRIIAEVFAVMYLTPDHIYQVLTKRDERMADVLNSKEFLNEFYEAVHRVGNENIPADKLKSFSYEEAVNALPLPNVHLGVSIENNEHRSRAQNLLRTPAAVRWLSCEPLIGPLDLQSVLGEVGPSPESALPGGVSGPKIDWAVVGGESGNGNIRPMHPEWVLDLQRQFEILGIAFFFKQWGGYIEEEQAKLNKVQLPPKAKRIRFSLNARVVPSDGSGDQGVNPVILVRLSKKLTGGLLNGKLVREYPKQLMPATSTVE